MVEQCRWLFLKLPVRYVFRWDVIIAGGARAVSRHRLWDYKARRPGTAGRGCGPGEDSHHASLHVEFIKYPQYMHKVYI